MAQRLQAMGLEVERRSIYRSIEELEQFGVDIIHEDQKNQGFYLASREFELPEVKLLMDAVQAARFITPGKSRKLMQKIAGLASGPQREALMDNVFVEDRAKCLNEQVYYHIDAITRAIREGRMIGFHYSEYNLRKHLVNRRGGEEYEASPYALTWSQDAYYLISRVSEHPGFTHFRVDRMKDVRVLDKQLIGYNDFYNDEKLNIGDYCKRAFSMFSGPLTEVTIRFADNLITPVLDKLGTDVRIVPDDQNPGHFLLRTELVVSAGLTAWLAHFGNGAEVVAPDSAREKVRDMLRDALRNYED
jgi:predicted DNA-binding transcriptional regulator YafY